MNQNIETKIETGFQHWIAAPEHKSSGETDFGVWWTLRGDVAADLRDPRWRVSWLAATGELYAVALEGARPDRYLLLSYFSGGSEVETALAGWAQTDSPIHHNLNALVE